MPTYDAVCFDLDHTLCVPTQDPEEVLATAFERVGCDPFCGHGDVRPLIPDLPTARTDREFHENLFAAAARRFEGDPTLAPDLAEAYLATADPSAVRFRDGAEAALALARERAEAVGLITNGSRETQTEKLESLGITDAFDVSVFVDPANGIPPKPEPAPFETAFAALGTGPEDAIHVGDSLYADVAGANAVGMDSAWLATDGGSDPAHEPTHVVDSLTDVGAIL